MAYDPEQITFFAKTDARGQHVPFGIKAKDRTRHVYVIGKTGMGKSTLLENMAVQDMQHGNGLAFIDPHGATAETLLQYVPENRADDVLYFAPFDTQHPIAFNVMEDVGPERRHLVAAGLMSVFKKIWVDAWSARMEYILQNTILALLEYPNSTLLGVNRMLSDKPYRQAVVDNIKDPAVRSFWVDEFANYNERYMQEAGDAIKNKIGQFTANPLIRNIIGQPHTSFDLRQMMDERKILIANLSKGLIGEGNANLLGSMLTTRIYLAAMSRADLEPQVMKQMPNYYFYVDEFQSFANATFADILSEARKYHLNLTIAHQYIEQMEEEVRNAVFGNVGTVISFRVGPFDAEVLETIFAPQFYAVVIVNLGFAQIYLSLMIDGIGSRPFSAVTLPPIEAPSVSCRDMVIARSRQLFASPRQAVEDDINAWMANSYAPKREERTGNGNGNGNGKGAGKRDSSRDGKREGAGGSHSQSPARRTDSAAKPRDAQRSNGRDERPPKRDTPPKPDLDALRNVLKAIAEPSAAEAAPAKKKPAHEPVATEGETPAAPANDRPEDTTPPQHPPKDTNQRQSAKQRDTDTDVDKSKRDGQRKKRPEQSPSAVPASDNQSSLKAALAAVLAEREARRPTPQNHEERKPAKATKSATATPAASTTQESAADTSTSASDHTPDSHNEPPPAPTPVRSDDQGLAAPPPASAPESAYRDTKSRDVLDPKVIERMLKVTGADNSPFKKR
jgi:hypothetical protein